jgi:hypothetical protein
MGANELGNEAGDGEEEARRTGGDTPARPEQPSRPETGDTGSDTATRTPAETRTREEYAEDMHGGDPMPSGGTGDDRAETEERGSAASEPRDGTSADEDWAEPRDRETYADDMRADSPDADRERVPTGDEDAGAPDDTAEGSYAEAGMELAEPRSRDEYAEAVRDGSLDGLEHTDGSAVDEASRETGTGWPADPGGDQDTTPEGPDPDTAVSEQETSGEQSGEADSPSSDPSATITHYHSDFKDQPVDLYTDGTRWATGERVDGENVVGEKPDRSPGDTSDLPPSGEELAETAGDGESSRLERLRRELYRHSDDAQDALEKNANLVHDVFSRPPTSSLEVSPVHRPYISEMPHYGADAGSVATAAFVLGVVIDRGVHQLMQNWQNIRERENDDAGD